MPNPTVTNTPDELDELLSSVYFNELPPSIARQKIDAHTRKKELEAEKRALDDVKEWLDAYDGSQTLATLIMMVFDKEQRIMAELKAIKEEK